MKYNYSISYPQTLCNAVHKTLHALKFMVSSPLIVDTSILSTISSSDYFVGRHSVTRCTAELSTNSP